MLEIGQLVDNKYRILDIVGKGGMSVVYLARNEKANKSWAIKEVRKVGEENLEVKRNSLIAETEMLKKLSHPNLPAIVDVIETDDTYLVVMDYIEGNDLGKVLEEYGAQPQEKVIEWGKQLCDVLGYLHSREKPIIYRDLKPANIMLKPDGKIMLIDFGTAREVKTAEANDTISLGTRGYAAPEQFGANAKTDARTDIYCLGATLYYLVTNHNPATEPYVMSPIRERNSSLSVGLEKIILKCTQPLPENRYQSCAELLYALEHYDTIDEKYRRKQKKKLFSFMASVFMILISLTVSGFGYFSAQAKKAENIDTYVIEAEKETNEKGVRGSAYKKAITLDPSNEEYYQGLLDLYLHYDDNGNPESNSLSLFEVTDLKSLEFQELYNSNNISTGKIYPLEEFRRWNKEGYEQFCNNAGISCWYYYNSSTSAETTASEWFKRYLDSVGEDQNENADFAKVYYSIGECKSQQTARMTENAEKYDKLWELIKNLYTLSLQTKDEESKVLGCKEITKEIAENGENFAAAENIQKDMLLEMLQNTKEMINDLYRSSNKNIRNSIDENFYVIKVDGARGNISDYFEDISAKIESSYR